MFIVTWKKDVTKSRTQQLRDERLHSCGPIHAWRNLGTSGDSSAMQGATSVNYAYNAASTQCHINAFGIHLVR